MDTATTITTAARRIARVINDTFAELTVSFDRDGRQVNAHSTGLWYANPADEPAHAAKLSGRRNRPEKLTQREAQDLLDADAYAAEHPEDPEAGCTYLLDLDTARRFSA
jgi:hypothetical protein